MHLVTASGSNEMIQLSWKEINENNDDFKHKFDLALRDGFFYVQIPDNIKHLISKAQEFGKSIRTDETLKQHDLGERLGYQARHGTQAVSFVSMKHQWKQVLPEAVKDLAIAMDTIALEILKASLRHLGVSEELWSKVTGKLTDGEGSNVFSFNNYKPGNEKIGLIPHKDMGWITVLFIDKTGLEKSLDGKIWKPIPPKEGYFVINFGRAFELLINKTDKLQASVHQVRRLDEERLSFGTFINHREGTNIHQISENGSLKELETYEQYMNRCFEEFQKLQNEWSQ